MAESAQRLAAIVGDAAWLRTGARQCTRTTRNDERPGPAPRRCCPPRRSAGHRRQGSRDPKGRRRDRNPVTARESGSRAVRRGITAQRTAVWCLASAQEST